MCCLCDPCIFGRYRRKWLDERIKNIKLCSAKELSKSISSAFKLIYNQIENFRKKANFWLIIIDFVFYKMVILSINKEKDAKCVSSYDFNTLYTKCKLPDVLITGNNELADFIFQGGKKLSLKLVQVETLFGVK